MNVLLRPPRRCQIHRNPDKSVRSKLRTYESKERHRRRTGSVRATL